MKMKTIKTNQKFVSLEQIEDLKNGVFALAGYFRHIANGANIGLGKKTQTMFDLDLALAQNNCFTGSLKTELLELAEIISDYAEQVNTVDKQSNDLRGKIELNNVPEDYSEYWQAFHERQYLNSHY